MNMRRTIAAASLILLLIVDGGLLRSVGWTQTLTSGGASVAGQAIGSDLIRQPGGTGTINFPSQNGNTYVYPWPAGTQNPGTQQVIDAIAFFKRPNPYMNGIPAGWNSINGHIWDCHSAVESPPSVGSFFAIRVRDINGNIVVDAGYPISVQWCYWEQPGGHYDIWDQAWHAVGNQNPPYWAPGPPAQQAVDGEKKNGGDPVELATGLFIMEQVDLAIPDLMPLTLTRTYRQNDPASRAFGIGATHPYDLWLIRDDYCSIS